MYLCIEGVWPSEPLPLFQKNKKKSEEEIRKRKAAEKEG